MEISVSCIEYRDCNGSFCSLHGMISGENDSLLLDDVDCDELDSQYSDSHLNSVTQNRSEDSKSEVHQNLRFSSQPSIATEMAIIASSSPEIKALTSKPIVTPNSPRDQEPIPQVSNVSSPIASVPSPVLTATTDHIGDQIHIMNQSKSKVGRDSLHMCTGTPNRTVHINATDELALYLDKLTIEMDPPTSTETVNEEEHKENVTLLYEYHDKTPETSNRSSGVSFTFKSSMRKEINRRHRSLSSLGVRNRRTEQHSFHRRVSFNSLPSPAEIAESPTRLPPIRTSPETSSTSIPTGKSPLAMDFPMC